MDLIDVSRIFHLAAAQYTFFSEAHGIFSKIEHILGNKVSLKKYKKIEITFYILSDHNGIKLDMNRKKNYGKYSNTWTEQDIVGLPVCHRRNKREKNP
jgi:hypothetical protein